MERVIVNEWRRVAEGGVEVARILRHDVHPEGLDFLRVRFLASGSYSPASDFGALVSVPKGELRLKTFSGLKLQLVAGSHLYLPPGSGARFDGNEGAELVLVLAPSAARARGERLLLRDDQFLSACALPERHLRWILTPQYLSRRVFLHHDRTLVSPTGDPLSWFHTTMFDVDGLPLNDEGVPVFKMSYNFRTEPNVCYEVAGNAKVRMAEHPYQDENQRWGPWKNIDDQTTYHLNEDPAQSEWRQGTSGARPLRNKHEIRIVHGHVSLMCMHDPAPTGAERHSAGEYSEYGDLAAILGLPEYKEYLELLDPLEHMVDTLSMAKASGQCLEELPEWSDYQEGLAAQRLLEASLHEALLADGKGRETIVRAWMIS